MAKSDITALLQELPKASLTRLRELWLEQIGREAAPELTLNVMRPVLAYRIQEKACGGLRPSTARQLEAVLRQIEPQRRVRQEASRRFQAGTRILREWKGKTYEVTVTSSGYEHDGRTYSSLSPIARLITGTRWSGPAFFGTRKGDRR